MEFRIRLCRGRKRALANKVEEGNGKLESHFMFLLSLEFCNKLDKTVVSFFVFCFFLTHLPFKDEKIFHNNILHNLYIFTITY